MKKALISPQDSVGYVSGWTANPDPASPQKYLPVLTPIENSARVAEVVANGSEFPVTPPLFWTDCADDVVADRWYYDIQTIEIIEIPAPAPYPS